MNEVGGQLMLQIYESYDGSALEHRGATFTKYDSNGRKVMMAYPGAVSIDASTNLASIETNVDLLGWNTNTSKYDYLEDNEGLIVTWTYSSGGQISGVFVQKGEDGTPTQIEGRTYESETVNGIQAEHLKTVSIYPDGSNAVTTTYTYGYNSDNADTSPYQWKPQTHVATRTTTLPVVATADNGSNVANQSHVAFDSIGNLTWSADARGVIHHAKYEDDHYPHLRTESIADTDTTTGAPALITSLARSSSVVGTAIAASTESTYDIEGDLVRRIGPERQALLTTESSGVYTDSSVTVRDAVWFASTESGHDCLDSIRVASGYVNGTTEVVVGTASIAMIDKTGRSWATIEATLPTTDPSDDLLDESWNPLSTCVGFSTAIREPGGRVVSAATYHNIPSNISSLCTPEFITEHVGTEGTHFAVTNLVYDATSRAPSRLEGPDGTILSLVSDPFGNITEVWTGTDDTGTPGTAPNNMMLLTEMEYRFDWSTKGSNPEADRVVQHVDASTTRVSTVEFDFRGRRKSVDGEENLFVEFDYDNLNRPTEITRRDGSSAGDRLSGTTINYDDLGRAFRSTMTGYVDDEPEATITTQRWFDAAGRLAKSQQGGAENVGGIDTSSAFSKLGYDGLGRLIGSYVAYDHDETSYADSVSSAVGSGGLLDTVIQRSDIELDDAGMVRIAKTMERLNDGSGTFDTYTVAWYDGSGQVSAAADYGTSVPPTSLPLPSAVVGHPMARVLYDEQQRPSRTVDPLGQVTRQIYDDLDRVVFTIENYVSGWDDATNTLDLASRSSDVDRVTGYEFDAPGRMVRAIAVDPDADGSIADNQITHYVYGPSADSEVATNSMLRAIIYPDSSNDPTNLTGTGMSSSFDRTEMAFNRQGQTIKRTDPRGVVTEFDFDGLGRMIDQRVVSLGRTAENVDGSIRRISYTYSTRGQLELVTNFSDLAGGSLNVVNEVEMAFNHFGQQTHDYQEHDGEVDKATTPFLGYTYASGSTDVKKSRLESILYPSGNTTLDVYYDDDADIALGRATGLKWGGSGDIIAEYDFHGLGRLAQKAIGFHDADAVFGGGEFALVLDMNDTTDAYDSLGRIARMHWKIDRPGSIPDATVFDLNQDFDDNGNRTFVRREASGFGSESRKYDIDGLNRIVSDLRGTLDSSGNVQGDPDEERRWDLDGVGNQTVEFDVANNVVRRTSHNDANEIMTSKITSDLVPSYVLEEFDASGDVGVVAGSGDSVSETGGLMTFSLIANDSFESEAAGIAILSDGRVMTDHAGSVKVRPYSGMSNGDTFGSIYNYLDEENYLIDAVVMYPSWGVAARQSFEVKEGERTATTSLELFSCPLGAWTELAWSQREGTGKVGIFSTTGLVEFDDFRVEPLDLKVALGGGWVSRTRTGSFIDEADDVLKILPGEGDAREVITVVGPGVDDFESIFSVQRSSNTDAATARINFAFHVFNQRDMNLLSLPVANASGETVTGTQISNGSETGVVDSGATGLAALSSTSDRRWYRVTYDGTSVQVFAVDQANEPTSWGAAIFDVATFSPPVVFSRSATGFSPGDTGEIDVDSFSLNTGLDAGVYAKDVVSDDFLAISDTGQSNLTAVTVSYDTAGNMVGKGNFTYAYDAWNRLVRIDAASAVVASYEYDGLNRRVIRIEGGIELHDYFKGWSVVETRDAGGSTGAVLHQSIWGLTYIDELIGVIGNADPGSDDDFSNVETDGVRRWAAHDMQFNVLGLIKAVQGNVAGDANGDRLVGLIDLDILGTNWGATEISGGATVGDFNGDQDVNLQDLDVLGSNWNKGDYYLVERYEYDIYGGRRAFVSNDSSNVPGLPVENSSSINGTLNSLQINPFGYQGRPHGAAGVIDFRTRPYDQEFGRFMTRDWFGYPDGMNGYAAFMGMFGSVDPFGLHASDAPHWHHFFAKGVFDPNDTKSHISLSGWTLDPSIDIHAAEHGRWVPPSEHVGRRGVHVNNNEWNDVSYNALQRQIINDEMRNCPNGVITPEIMDNVARRTNAEYPNMAGYDVPETHYPGLADHYRGLNDHEDGNRLRPGGNYSPHWAPERPDLQRLRYPPTVPDYLKRAPGLLGPAILIWIYAEHGGPAAVQAGWEMTPPGELLTAVEEGVVVVEHMIELNEIGPDVAREEMADRLNMNRRDMNRERMYNGDLDDAIERRSGRCR